MGRLHTIDRSGPHHLQGTVTEDDLDIAEQEFPGISAFYEDHLESQNLPTTFLELLCHFGAFEVGLPPVPPTC